MLSIYNSGKTNIEGAGKSTMKVDACTVQKKNCDFQTCHVFFGVMMSHFLNFLDHKKYITFSSVAFCKTTLGPPPKPSRMDKLILLVSKSTDSIRTFTSSVSQTHRQTNHLSHEKKKRPYFPLNPGWLIGILIMVY